MQVYSILIFVVLAIQSIHCNLNPHDGELVPSYPPKFRIDLNVEPEHRWDHIVPYYSESLHNFVSQILDPLPISDATYTKLGIYFNNFYKYKEVVKEVKGIVKALPAPKVRWEKIMLANFFYESSTIPMCSSILVKNRFGKTLHGRNLDFPYWNIISKMVAKVQVYKGDEYIGVWNHIIGGAIVLSGISYEKFSITTDTRVYNGPVKDILDNIFIKEYVPSSILTRYVLTNEKTFEEATETLQTTTITAPIYYIIGGTDQGMVIEKKVEGYKQKRILGEDGGWFLVQTNYDDGEDPFSDDRKTPATLRLEAIGQENINPENFFELLTKYPTLNVTTIYSLMYSAYYNINDIALWYGSVDSQEQLSENDWEKMMESEDVQRAIARGFEAANILENTDYLDRLLDNCQKKQILS